MKEETKEETNGVSCLTMLLIPIGVVVLFLSRGCWSNLFKSDYDRAVETEYEAYEMLRKAVGEGSYRAEQDMKERDRFWEIYNEAH